jgi:RNA polymerase sigma-70 factor (ECF subfamily)
MVELSATEPTFAAASLAGRPRADRAPASDRDARLTAALRTHFASVWRTVEALGVPRTYAEDVAQRVFLVFSEKLGRVSLGSERAFLMATAVRMAANARRQVVPEHPMEVDGVAHPGPDAEQLLQNKQARELLDELLASMPYEQREAFLLFELEQLSIREVAQALGVPRGTAASRLRAARLLFQAGVQRLSCRIARQGGHR